MATKRVLVGLSGGVDSLVTALLLKKQGFEVISTTLCFFQKDIQTEQRIKQLADRLDVAHTFIDGTELFKKYVTDYVIRSHQNGRTPCACAVCNPNVKFKLLLASADQFDCDFIATGHYIRLQNDGAHRYIFKARDTAKDQSYFLWNLTEEVLKRWLTPLGALTKPQVLQVALESGFEDVANAKESMGACFINQTGYQSYLKSRLGPALLKEGAIVNTQGKIIGRHKGAALYTIGQQKGLILHQHEKGMAVKKTDIPKNQLVAVEVEQLYQKSFDISGCHFINSRDLQSEHIQAKIRGIGLNPMGYANLQPADGENIRVTLEHPAWAVAPGQPAVFYIGERLIGGGFIN